MLTLVGIFFAATLVYTVKLGETLRYPDEGEYLNLARNLAVTGHYTLNGSTPTAFRPPVYPLFLAAGIKLGASITALRIANLSTLLACMGLIYLLLRKSSSTQAGIAVLLVMSYPVLIYTASTFYPQIPSTALFLGSLALLFSSEDPKLRCYFFAGAGMSLTMLMVPSFGFALIFTAGFTALCRLHKNKLARTFLLLCGASLVLAPWTARNALVFGRFIPFSTNSGINLLLGNSENTTPNSGTTTDISHYERSAQSLPEVDANDYYTKQAIIYIKAHPLITLKRYAGKVINYFNFQNRMIIQTEQSQFRMFLMLFSYGLLLGLAILRLAMTYRHPLTLLEKYITWLYLLSVPVSAIFFTRIRFRLPMDVLLTILSASAVVIIINYVNSHTRITKKRGSHLFCRNSS